VRLAARLVLWAAGILLFSIILMVWSFRNSLRRDLESALTQSLQREAELVRDALPADPRAWDRPVGGLARERGHRVTILDPRGAPIADNSVSPSQLRQSGPFPGLPEVRAAMEGQVGVARRVEAGGRRHLWVAVPGDPIVRVGSDLIAVEQAVGTMHRSVLWAALLALAVGSGLAYGGAQALARPLRELRAAARDLPSRVSSVRVPRSAVAEIGQLSQALRDAGHELTARLEAVSRGRAESAVLVDAMVEGVLSTDRRGRIVIANPAARRLLGYASSEPLPDLPQLFRAKAAREVVEATMRGETVQERELELGDRVVTVSSRPLASGGAVLVLHDLTRLRQLEAVRRDFLANVSHEFKTPLTSVAGYAETLLDTEPDAATRRRFLATILSNARRMQQLVEDQLSLARIESGRWQPRIESLDAAAAARECWATRAARAEADGIRFLMDAAGDGSRLAADPEAVRQILGNLFDNAIRHTPSGGEIVFRARAEDGGIALSVSDTGSGIAGEHLPRIFERYYRADPGRARDQGGTGLGLAIVKHLVESHGGWVRAASELNAGTTVTCWFPGSAGPA